MTTGTIFYFSRGLEQTDEVQRGMAHLFPCAPMPPICRAWFPVSDTTGPFEAPSAIVSVRVDLWASWKGKQQLCCKCNSDLEGRKGVLQAPGVTRW